MYLERLSKLSLRPAHIWMALNRENSLLVKSKIMIATNLEALENGPRMPREIPITRVDQHLPASSGCSNVHSRKKLADIRRLAPKRGSG